MKKQQAVRICCIEQDYCRFTLKRKKQKGGENCTCIQRGLIHEMEDEIWEGVATREVEAPEDILWEQVSNFGQIKSWHTSAEICEDVEGENNKPGCVRYCAGGGRASDGSPARWVKEKLLTLDLAGRHMTYCILDSSYGFQELQGLAKRYARIWKSTIEMLRSHAFCLRSTQRNSSLDIPNETCDYI
ncbi:hypothetical protein KP509_1Z039300 [Ceratopteris richardii]|nr:hypothetical protein KP509_1Z039300 [Ceratopteris richardii]